MNSASQCKMSFNSFPFASKPSVSTVAQATPSNVSGERLLSQNQIGSNGLVFAVKSKPPPVESLLDTSDEGPLDPLPLSMKPKRRRCKDKSNTSTQHLKNPSSDGCTFVCSICDAKLKNKRSLWKHHQRLHSKNNGPDRLTCTFCGSPQLRNNIKKHQKTKKCRKFQN